MKFYVPEIGDHIRLTKDWEFELHPEGRNEQLGALFNHRLWHGWIDNDLIDAEPNQSYTVNYPDESKFRSWFGNWYREYRDACTKAEQESESYQAYLKAWEEWRAKATSIAKPTLKVTLPAGTVLAVDRIYIRKGASDFSSITFFAKQLGEVEIKNRWSGKSKKVKALRFWAKLSDCNTIEFETITQ